MARHQNDSLRVLRIGSFEHGVDIRDHRWRRYSLAHRLREAVRFYLQATAAIVRVTIELAFDPLPGGSDSMPRRNRRRVLRRNGTSCLKADQLLDVSLDLLR